MAGPNAALDSTPSSADLQLREDRRKPQLRASGQVIPHHDWTRQAPKRTRETQYLVLKAHMFTTRSNRMSCRYIRYVLQVLPRSNIYVMYDLVG